MKDKTQQLADAINAATGYGEDVDKFAVPFCDEDGNFGVNFTGMRTYFEFTELGILLWDIGNKTALCKTIEEATTIAVCMYRLYNPTEV